MDTVGNIYEYQGRIIRVINPEYNDQTRDLLKKDGLIQDLVKNQLVIDTWISDLFYPGADIVLEHRKIEVKSYMSQWSFEMMRDAALLVLKINAISEKYGYELKDCHQANILFDGVKPVWIDFGSFAKKTYKKWGGGGEFLKYYYLPMLLWRKGYDSLVANFWKTSGGIELSELISIAFHLPPKIAKRGLKYIVTILFNPKRAEKRIKSLEIRQQSYWGNYQDSYWEVSSSRFDDSVSWIQNHSDAIESMVEIGANQGMFSYLVAQKTDIKKIIATDYDSQSVNTMYKIMKQKGVEIISPLVVDFVWSSVDFLKNYQSDLLVANALTHHLLLTQGMAMKAMLDKFEALTRKYIIVEFMPKGVDERNLPDWYTEEWFMQSLSERFEILDISKKTEGRVRFIGLKKK